MLATEEKPRYSPDVPLGPRRSGGGTLSDPERYSYEDEISLRDLYLVLRRGLPVILLSALLVGAVTFLVSSLLPKVYEAQSTTLVTPPPVQVQGAQNLSFRPPNEVSFETYETLAGSRPVREATLEAVGDTPATGVGSGFNGSVDLLIGPQTNQQASLLVTHSVRDTRPARAAALANAWAASTLDAVKTSLLASLDPVRAATEEEIARRKDALSEVETRFETFQRTDEGETLTALLQRLTERIADSEERRDTLARDLASAQARAELLSQAEVAAGSSARADTLAEILTLQNRAASGEDAGVEGSDGDSERNAGSGQDTVTPQERARLASLLRLQGDDALTGSVVALLNETELRDAAVDLAGLTAEQNRIETQLTGYQQQVETLLGRIAALNLERDRLELELTNARDAYTNVVALEPIITYVTTITPGNARLLNEASVPAGAVAPRRALNTALAVVLTLILAILFVFLREAVSAPSRPEKKGTV